MISVTVIIIAITSIVSFIAFSNNELFNKLKFNAYLIKHKKQYYRFLSHAVVHGGTMHLFINMFVLFSFGKALEQYFAHYIDYNVSLLMVALYVGSIIFSSLFDYEKQKNNHYYNAVGASGAVSAVLFATIFFAPMHKIYFFGVIPIPGIIFGVLYLFYEYKMAKKDMDNIGHNAHFFGAIFGFLFPLIIKPKLIYVFLNGFF